MRNGELPKKLGHILDEAQLSESKMTERQRRILETAIELFAEKGYNGVSTSEIAAKADVAEATIFKHFRTKKGLLLSIVAPTLAKVATPVLLRSLRVIMRSDEEQELERALQTLFLDRVHVLDNNWNLVKVIVRELQYHPELWQMVQEHLAKRVYDVIEEVVQAKQGSGHLRSDLPSYAIVRTIFSMVFGYVVSKHLFQGIMQRETDDEEMKVLVDIILNGIAQ